MKSGIYSITNLINKKIYIGSAVNIHKRWRDHRSTFKLQKHHNSHLQSSWNLYGESNFLFEVVEYCTVDKIIEREKYYILLYNSKDNKFGYNVNDPEHGFLGVRHNKETKEKLSIQKLGLKNPMFGKTGNKHPNFGKTHSTELIQKMSLARKGKGGLKGELSPVSKLDKNQVLEIRSKYIYRIYSTEKLAKEYNVTRITISNIINRRSWTHI